MSFIDLHLHSFHSDGSFSPAKVVEEAAKAGLSALALTDHDTTLGLSEAAGAAKKLGIEFVPGIELFALGADGTDVHILGLLIEDTSVFEEHTRKMAVFREKGLRGMIAEFNRAFGCAFSLDDLKTKTPETMMSAKGFFARALAREGFYPDYATALNAVRPFPLEWGGLPLAKAVELIHRAGGVAVLAHPGLLPPDKQKPILFELAELGLDGVEAYHSRHTLDQRQKFRGYAEALGLALSGGSDSHGAHSPDLLIGKGPWEGPYIPAEFLQQLKAKRR